MAIRADRRNYVMSVELAMQREMEFRQKLINQSPLQPQVAQILTPIPILNVLLLPLSHKIIELYLVYIGYMQLVHILLTFFFEVDIFFLELRV